MDVTPIAQQLQVWAAAEGVPISEVEAINIAMSTATASDHERHGLLIRILAVASLTGQPITHQLVDDVINGARGEQASRLN